MEEVIIKLKDAAALREAIARQECSFWQKLSEVADAYLRCQQKLNQDRPSPPQSTIAFKPAAGEYLNTEQAAKYIGFASGTLTKWRCVGGGPKFRKAGGAIRYKVEDLDAFLANVFPHTSAYRK